jgi:hypothetical protein
VLGGLPLGDGGLAILFHFSLFYFYSTHQMLVRLPEGVGSLAILFDLILFHFL